MGREPKNTESEQSAIPFCPYHLAAIVSSGLLKFVRSISGP